MSTKAMRILVLADEPGPGVPSLLAHAVPAAAVRQLPPGRDPAGVVREARSDVVPETGEARDHRRLDDPVQRGRNVHHLVLRGRPAARMRPGVHGLSGPA